MAEPGEEMSDAIERDLNAAIADVIARHERGVVTKWVALVETMNPDGARGMWPMTSEDVMAWDVIGMLLHGLNLQQAQMFAEVMGGPDE